VASEFETVIVWNIIPEFTAKINAEAAVIKHHALERIVEEARSRVRVASGDTRDSIAITEDGDGVEAGFAAKFLEYGTVKMSAYPFLGPAAKSVQESFAAEFAAMFRL
jgi:HK97 gp10 family phage protein